MQKLKNWIEICLQKIKSWNEASKFYEKKTKSSVKLNKIAWLSPKDVNMMANDKSSIEVLQQIAMNHNLSPNDTSSLNPYSKENSGVLIHPLYPSLSQKLITNKENLKSAIEKSKDQEGSRKLHEANSQRFKPSHKSQNQDSFQSISSVSLKYEESGTTDIQLEDFFDSRRRNRNSENN